MALRSIFTTLARAARDGKTGTTCGPGLVDTAQAAEALKVR